jgi:hypothetical protein
MISSVETVPRLNGLPNGLPPNDAVEIEVEEGVLIFRVSKNAQERIKNLLDKNKQNNLTDSEKTELDRFEEIDDYLSFLNRLTRNLAENNSEEKESVS